jgi:hypothetical protein
MIRGYNAYEDVRKKGFRLQFRGSARHIEDQIESARLDIFESPVIPRYNF